MRYLSVIRKKSLTERNETDTCPLTYSKRVTVIEPGLSINIIESLVRTNDFFVERFFTDVHPSFLRTHVIAALKMLGRYL